MNHDIRTKTVEANGLTFQVDTCGTGSRFALCHQYRLRTTTLVLVDIMDAIKEGN